MDPRRSSETRWPRETPPAVALTVEGWENESRRSGPRGPDCLTRTIFFVTTRSPLLRAQKRTPLARLAASKTTECAAPDQAVHQRRDRPAGEAVAAEVVQHRAAPSAGDGELGAAFEPRPVFGHEQRQLLAFVVSGADEPVQAAGDELGASVAVELRRTRASLAPPPSPTTGSGRPSPFRSARLGSEQPDTCSGAPSANGVSRAGNRGASAAGSRLREGSESTCAWSFPTADQGQRRGKSSRPVRARKTATGGRRASTAIRQALRGRGPCPIFRHPLQHAPSTRYPRTPPAHIRETDMFSRPLVRGEVRPLRRTLAIAAGASLLLAGLPLAGCGDSTPRIDGSAAGLAGHPPDTLAWIARLASSADGGDGVAALELARLRMEAGPPWSDLAEGRRRLSQAETAGNRDAWVMEGLYRLDARGFERDEAAARESFRRAAEAGSGAGAFNLGRLLDHAIGGPRDAAEAARWYLAAVDRDSLPGAANNLALLHETGDGVDRDPARAELLLHAAAARGHAGALGNLLRYRLHSPFGLAPNPEAAWDLVVRYRAADRAGEDSGLIGLLVGHPRLRARALEQLAVGGPIDAGAALLVGSVLEQGAGGEPDPEGARTAYRRAADLGSAEGALRLGSLEVKGSHPERAEALFRQAGEGGDPVGWLNLGWFHLMGSSGKPDRRAALEAFRRGDEAGEPVCSIELALLGMEDAATPADSAAARALAERGRRSAGEYSILPACELLMRLDPARQEQAWRRAAAGGAMGDVDALVYAAECRLNGIGAPRCPAAALASLAPWADDHPRAAYVTALACLGDSLRFALEAEGVPVDDPAASDPGCRADCGAAEGVQRLERAAELGSADALPMLATVCLQGVGRSPDRLMAAKWTRLLVRLSPGHPSRPAAADLADSILADLPESTCAWLDGQVEAWIQAHGAAFQAPAEAGPGAR